MKEDLGYASLLRNVDPQILSAARSAFGHLADAGYEEVELWGGLPHAFTDDFYADGSLDQTLVAWCRSIVAKSGLTPVCFLPEQCIYPVNFLVDAASPSDAAKLRERSLRYFERAIDLTAELGFHRMLVTTPFWGWTQEGGAWRHRDKLCPALSTRSVVWSGGPSREG